MSFKHSPPSGAVAGQHAVVHVGHRPEQVNCKGSWQHFCSTAQVEVARVSPKVRSNSQVPDVAIAL